MAVGGSVKMKADRGGELQDEVTCLDGQMRVKPARIAFAGVVELSTIERGSTDCPLTKTSLKEARRGLCDLSTMSNRCTEEGHGRKLATCIASLFGAAV
jgi:hypothetical protein